MEEKGKAGEQALNLWLHRQRLSYLYVGQSPDTFARLFPRTIKRPDFLVLLVSIGLIAVDAKNYKRWKGGYYSLNLEKELKPVLTFERLFRIPVWYAYMDEEGSGSIWRWISALKAVEVGKRKTNKQEKSDFLLIEASDFVRVETNNDLCGLYSQSLSSLDRISEVGWPYK
jgi:hypothetical protein